MGLSMNKKMDRAAYLSSTTLSNIQLVINHYCSRLILYILYSIRSSSFSPTIIYTLYALNSLQKKKKKDKFVAIPFVFFSYHYPCLIPDSLRLSKMAHVNIDFSFIYVNNSEVKPLQLSFIFERSSFVCSSYCQNLYKEN